VRAQGDDLRTFLGEFVAVAWFLPIVKDGVTFPHGLPEWYNAVLSTISATTTLLFIFRYVWVMSRGLCTLPRASAWIATSAFILNAHWYVLFGSDRKDLRVGYFLWWFSFLLLAIGLFDLSRQKAANLLS
jgi:hypothetical protein